MRITDVVVLSERKSTVKCVLLSCTQKNMILTGKEWMKVVIIYYLNEQNAAKAVRVSAVWTISYAEIHVLWKLYIRYDINLGLDNLSRIIWINCQDCYRSPAVKFLLQVHSVFPRSAFEKINDPLDYAFFSPQIFVSVPTCPNVGYGW